MPYVAPEVLKGKSYTQAADIYNFGMIMYFVATGRQPFSNCAHDEILVLNICNGIRPKISESEAPKCYIDLMKRILKIKKEHRHHEIEKQFKKAEECRKSHLSLSDENERLTTHPQAIYTSRLLNPFSKDLPKYDNINNNSVEVIDITSQSTIFCGN
ncbi:kinase-like domain-containing protein [Glomus cerebriforme]|uniref:Kinase-like domain-containing protein n=1 Tax=Glomus cerebriforme TaxID=658196 RepID=A0A397SS48_9GLOM|nr:kinase-like domain-containing protein [Glomus cerebriforme]